MTGAEGHFPEGVLEPHHSSSKPGGLGSWVQSVSPSWFIRRNHRSFNMLRRPEGLQDGSRSPGPRRAVGGGGGAGAVAAGVRAPSAEGAAGSESGRESSQAGDDASSREKYSEASSMAGSHSKRVRVREHVRKRVAHVKEKLDDPTLAWFCLFVSAVVLITRIILKLNPSPAALPPPPVASSAKAVPAYRAASGCLPLDEVCAARMLSESEGVSHFEDVSTHAFYSLMSQYATYLITFIALYLFSFAGLRRYQRKRDRHERHRSSLGMEQLSELQQLLAEEPVNDNDDFIPFALCALSVSVSIGALLLVPITILYGFWLKVSHGDAAPPDVGNDSDFRIAWELLFPLSNLCHFIVLPSAFFYSESEGFGFGVMRPTHAGGKVFSRLVETGITVALVLALLSLPIMAFQSLRILQYERLAFSYVITASCGAAMFLVFAPFGFDRLIRRSFRALHVRNESSGPGGGVEVLTCELEAKLEELRRVRESAGDVGRLLEEVRIVEQQIRTCSLPGRSSPSCLSRLRLWANLSVNIMLPVTVLVRVVMWQVTGQTSRMPLSLFLTPAPDKRSGRYPSDQLALEAIHVAFDMCLLCHLWISTWHGVRNVPILSMIYTKQRARGLTERVLALHSLLFLCINTSYPLITCAVGLTQIEHVRDNSATEYFQRPGVVLGFNVIFMAACTCALGHAVVSNLPGGGARLARAICGFVRLSISWPIETRLQKIKSD